MRKYIVVGVLFCLVKITGFAQTHSDYISAVDSTNKKKILDEVVVTATRTYKKKEDIPIPVTTITAEEIANRGVVRLNEILAEQTGLTIVSDHGTGIQMQGFDPQYTLILIDGEPLIGRTSGTLELSRLTLNNIDRIEIIKGPSSSLYGSEAMAGVINIITKNIKIGHAATLATRYGTNNTADLSGDLSYSNEKFKISGFLNRYSSDGYTLRDDSPFQTVSPFVSYTTSGKLGYRLSDKTSLDGAIRYYVTDQDDRYLVDDRIVSGDGNQKELSILPTLLHRFSDFHKSTVRLYHTSYKTKSDVYYEDINEVYDQTYFNQSFYRGEWQHDYQVRPNMMLTGGIGIQKESVTATRYDDKKYFNSQYGYVQGDWKLLDRINVIMGGRYDAHSVYKSQFSPKIAVSYRANSKITVMASASRGYKAPDFRQLYLNFTNAIVGYSVFGYEDLASNISRLQNEGQIRELLLDPTTLKPLNAESSWAYQLGARIKPVDKLHVNINLFRNNVENLITTASVAIKTNGQAVYSYFNRNKVFTQGIELDASYALFHNLEIAGGIQYLDAKDVEEWNKVKDGTVYTRDKETGRTRVVLKSEYGGLMNRSKYMANARLSFTESSTGLILSLRWNYRGRYGIRDLDGNGILNMDSEFIDGYSIFNGAISKGLLRERLRIQLTVDNALNFTNKDYITHLPGRLVHVGCSYSF